MKLQAGIRNKILAIVVLSALALIGVSLVGLDYIHRQMMDDRATTLREVVTLALAEADQAKKDMDSGKLTRDQALDSLRQQLHLLRFGSDHKDYIFSNFMDGVAFANAGNPAIEGSNLIAKEGPDHRKVFAELIDGVRQHNGGVLIYLWPPPGKPQEIARKMAYYTGFPAFDLVVGAGVYIDDIDRDFRAIAIKVAIISGILLAVTIALSLWAAFSITRPLESLGAHMRRLADGQLDEEIDELNRKDEIGKMAQTVFVFRQNAREMRRLDRMSVGRKVPVRRKGLRAAASSGSSAVPCSEVLSAPNPASKVQSLLKSCCRLNWLL